MTTSLLIHDRIRTTDAKAKELRKFAERMITLARKARKFGSAGTDDKSAVAKSLHYRRQALQYLSLPKIDASNPDDRAERKEILDKLFVDLADRYMERAGGYTRVLKIGNRRGDGAPVSLIKFVEESLEESSKPSKKKSKKKKKAAPAAKAAADKPSEQTPDEEAVEETEETAAPEQPTEEPEAVEEAAQEKPVIEEEEPESQPEPEPAPEEKSEEKPDENEEKKSEE